MRQVDDHARRGLAHRIDHRFIGFRRRVIFAFQRGRRGEQRQMIAALDQQAVEQHIVEAFRRRQRVGDALAGLVVEIQARPCRTADRDPRWWC